MHKINLESLTPAQRQAVEAPFGPVLVVAGAGTGKTRTLIHRIGYLLTHKGQDPGLIFAVTFTNRAAREMTSRLKIMLPGADFLPFVGTFHRLGLLIMAIEHQALGLEAEFPVLDRVESIRLLKDRVLNRWEDLDLSPREAMERISLLKGLMLTPEQCMRPGAPDEEQILAPILEAYDNELRRIGGVDFDDLISMPVKMLQNDAAILARWQNKVKHLLVDEYQDVNPAQAELARLLAGSGKNIFAIGDADQAIYAFRGANVINFLEFHTRFPGAVILRLEENFRSFGAIIDAAQALVENNTRRIPKRLTSVKPGGPKIRLVLLDDEKSEARFILETIEEFLGGSSFFEHDSNTAGGHLQQRAYGFSDFAVLARLNAQLQPLARAFQRWGIPYQWVGAGTIADRPEARALISHLKAAALPDDETALISAMTMPPRGIGPGAVGAMLEFCSQKELKLFRAVENPAAVPGLSSTQVNAVRDFGKAFAELRTRINAMTALEALKHVLDATGLANHFNASDLNRDPMETWLGLQSMAVKHDRIQPPDSVKAFIEDLALMSDADAFDERLNAVALMTLHAAKGLEFPVVIITGMEPGLVPLWHKGLEPDQDQIEEERRLIHVGMTRARERLILTRTRKRFLFGERRINGRSPFLEEIPKDLIEELVVEPREPKKRAPEPPPDNQLSLF